MTTRIRAAVLTGLVAILAACSPAGGDGQAPADTPIVEVFTNYEGAEAEAFRDVLADFTEQTGIRTRFIGTAAFAARLPERVRDGDPPDVALIPQPALLAELAREGRVVPLDLPGAGRTLLPGADAVGMVDGRRVGIWFRLSVKSLVWYPPAAFEAAGYEIPATWEDLLALSDRMQADGVTPWCFGMEAFGSTGWVGTDWIEDLVLRFDGPAVYDRWVAGQVPFTDERIRRAFEAFTDLLLTDGRTAAGPRTALTIPAFEAILPMLDDPPGCLLSRQVSSQAASLPADTVIGPGGDLDIFLLPSTDGGPAPLVAAGEVAAAFDDRPETRALLEFLADPAAGESWARRGGFTSPHASFDATAYSQPLDLRIAELVARSEVVRFDGSDQMPTQVGTGAFWTGMIDVVGGAPIDRVLARIEAARSVG